MSDPNAVFQNAFYVGNNFNAILYGVELVLYFASVWLILQARGRTSKRSDRLFLFFSTGLLLMITIYVAVQAVFGQEMWIVNANYPGGSAQYLADNAAIWYETLGSAASVVLNLMSDGLLIYRTYIVWSDWRVAIFPSILYFGSAGGLRISRKPNPCSDAWDLPCSPRDPHLLHLWRAQLGLLPWQGCRHRPCVLFRRHWTELHVLDAHLRPHSVGREAHGGHARA
ncbi:hypothetical protein NUW54_g11974 [Trametes sanguinea]|uniref:Uncharacterized protein n=1 Tax=Trametes sanguinea TaxID=158606 RepID=A0ACC1N4C0_9APHY|nr:hypothetical protein NUW54_g11974 [Trametes sanguinea]